MLEALLQQRMGARNAAHRCLRKALQLGRKGRYVRCLLDEGDGIIELLRETYQNLLQTPEPGGAAADPDREYIELLLEASGTDLGRQAIGSRLTEPLSDREKEMLRFLLNGINQPRDRRRLFRVGEHRQVPPEEHLLQARRRQPAGRPSTRRGHCG